jgi:hypothetical protein
MLSLEISESITLYLNALILLDKLFRLFKTTNTLVLGMFWQESHWALFSFCKK